MSEKENRLNENARKFIRKAIAPASILLADVRWWFHFLLTILSKREIFYGKTVYAIAC